MASFQMPKSIEKSYAVSLRKVAKIIGGIVETYTVNGRVVNERALLNALSSYSESLDPWAHYIAGKTLGSISASNERMWKSLSRRMGKGLEKEIEAAPIEDDAEDDAEEVIV